jgi:hypothetical protein
MSTHTIAEKPPAPVDHQTRRREVFALVYRLFAPRRREQEAQLTGWTTPPWPDCDLDSLY